MHRTDIESLYIHNIDLHYHAGQERQHGKQTHRHDEYDPAHDPLLQVTCLLPCCPVRAIVVIILISSLAAARHQAGAGKSLYIVQ